MKVKMLVAKGTAEGLPKPDDIYLALFRKKGVWNVSGVIYHSLSEIRANLGTLHPDKILAVRVEMAKEIEKALKE